MSVTMLRFLPAIFLPLSRHRDNGNYLESSVMPGRADRRWWMAVRPVITTGSPGRRAGCRLPGSVWHLCRWARADQGRCCFDHERASFENLYEGDGAGALL